MRLVDSVQKHPIRDQKSALALMTPDPPASPHVVAVPNAPPVAPVAQDISTAAVLGADVAVVDVALAVQAAMEVCAATAMPKPVV